MLRPNELLTIKTAAEKDQVSEAELVAVEDKEIKKIVDIQNELGYSAASDGEYRRHSKSSTSKVADKPRNKPCR